MPENVLKKCTCLLEAKFVGVAGFNIGLYLHVLYSLVRQQIWLSYYVCETFETDFELFFFHEEH